MISNMAGTSLRRHGTIGFRLLLTVAFFAVGLPIQRTRELNVLLTGAPTERQVGEFAEFRCARLKV